MIIIRIVEKRREKIRINTSYYSRDREWFFQAVQAVNFVSEPRGY